MSGRDAGGAGDGAVSRLTELLTTAHVEPTAAAAYAREAARSDGTLIVVKAAFSRAVPAEMALDTFGADALDVPDRFHMGTDRYNPTPLSNALNLPLLKQGPESKETSFGLPLLSRNPAPLSSLLGLPTLTRSHDDRNR